MLLGVRPNRFIRENCGYEKQTQKVKYCSDPTCMTVSLVVPGAYNLQRKRPEQSLRSESIFQLAPLMRGMLGEVALVCVAAAVAAPSSAVNFCLHQKPHILRQTIPEVKNIFLNVTLRPIAY